MQAEQVQDPFIGTVIQDRYTVLKKLGEGGMGAVYLGEHNMIRKKVAIKVLHGQFARNDDVVKRFHREALAATSIGNEHIVEVTDMGHLADGALFMVLEFLEGSDFSHDIDENGAQPTGRVVRVLMQMCDGLSAAHEKGIVHRDLKPENVFLIKRGDDPDFVKILDFGISKFRSSLDGGEARMTATGTALGTPYFMSPEQAESSADVDHRTDIYALGCIMYNALTGQFPFDAESYPALILAICTKEPPPLTELRPDVPPELAAIVHRALAKRREDRFADCMELKAALVPFKGLDAPPPIVTHTDAHKAAAMFSATDGMADTRASGEQSAAPGGSLGTSGAAGAAGDVTHGQSGIRAASEPPAKSKLALVAGALAVLAAIGGAFALGGSSEPPAAGLPAAEAASAAPPPSPAAAPPPAAAPATASADIHVTIHTTPPGAALFIDGSRIANPFDGELPKNAVPRTLEAELEGYERISQPLVLQFPQNISLRMVATPTAREPAARRSRSTRRAKDDAAAPVPSAAPAPPPAAAPPAAPAPAAAAPKPSPPAPDKPGRDLKKLF